MNDNSQIYYRESSLFWDSFSVAFLSVILIFFSRNTILTSSSVTDQYSFLDFILKKIPEYCTRIIYVHFRTTGVKIEGQYGKNGELRLGSHGRE